MAERPGPNEADITFSGLNQPSFDKGGHFLRGQMARASRFAEQHDYINLSRGQVSFQQRRFMKRIPRDGK